MPQPEINPSEVMREFLREATHATAEIASNVKTDQLDGPTPCSGFTVGDLVNHLAGDDGASAVDNLAILARGESPRGPNLNIDLFEIVLHGWDLAVSTGATLQVSDALAEELLQITRRVCIDERRGGGKPFANEVRVVATAPAFDKALGLSGRDPGWSA